VCLIRLTIVIEGDGRGEWWRVVMIWGGVIDKFGSMMLVNGVQVVWSW